MPAVETDLTIEQGTTFARGWQVTYLGQPIDGTWTAASQVRAARASDADLLHTFQAGVTSGGAVVLTVPHAVSSGWDWTSGYYDVEVTNAAGTVRLRVAQGKVRVSREVTADVAV